ncbi:hypothetical protein NWF32_20980 [Pseudomonas qingdaonensis]|nr:hypothetical protein [Pseudomonas qingdaonensis]
MSWRAADRITFMVHSELKYPRLFVMKGNELLERVAAVDENIAMRLWQLVAAFDPAAHGLTLALNMASATA